MELDLGSQRIRSTANSMELDGRRILSDINAHTVLFKMVAEDLEKQGNSKAVTKLKQGLLAVLESAHHLDQHCSALQNIKQTFQTSGEEETDFRKCLKDQQDHLQSQAPFNPATHHFYDQFNRSLWSINHPGEPMPGEEQEEVVMMSSQFGILNQTCPLSGKRVIELEEPVRSSLCHHVYEKSALMNYIAIKLREFRGKKMAHCAIPGCPKDLRAEDFTSDAALKMEIQELRLRESHATQSAAYDNVDLEED